MHRSLRIVRYLGSHLRAHATLPFRHFPSVRERDTTPEYIFVYECNVGQAVKNSMDQGGHFINTHRGE